MGGHHDLRRPGGRHTNDISIEFREPRNALVHIIFGLSQWNFTHVTTVKLSWRVWNFVVHIVIQIRWKLHSAVIQFVVKPSVWKFSTCHDCCTVVICAHFYSDVVPQNGVPIFHRIWTTMEKPFVMWARGTHSHSSSYFSAFQIG